MISDKNSSRWTIAHTTNSEIVTKVKISERQIFEHIKVQIELNFEKILDEEEELVLAYILSGKRLKDIRYLNSYTSKSYLVRKRKDIASCLFQMLSVIFSASVNIHNLRSLAEKHYLNNKKNSSAVYRERKTK